MSPRPVRKKLGAVCCALALFTVTVMPAQAAMVGTDNVISEARAEQTRTRLMNLVERDAVRDKLVAMGVDPDHARGRIARLTDAEVARLQGRLDEAPAGAGAGAVLGVAAIVFVAFVVTDALGITDVFPFIDPVARPTEE